MQDQTDLSRSWSSHHDTELEPEPNIHISWIAKEAALILFLFISTDLMYTYGKLLTCFNKIKEEKAQVDKPSIISIAFKIYNEFKNKAHRYIWEKLEI